MLAILFGIGFVFTPLFVAQFTVAVKSCWIQWNEINVNICIELGHILLNLNIWYDIVQDQKRREWLCSVDSVHLDILFVCCHFGIEDFYMPLCVANTRDTLQSWNASRRAETRFYRMIFSWLPLQHINPIFVDIHICALTEGRRCMISHTRMSSVFFVAVFPVFIACCAFFFIYSNIQKRVDDRKGTSRTKSH